MTRIAGLGNKRGCCQKCVHFVRREGWWCSLVTLPAIQAKGYPISAESLPNPEEFVCDEDYEPP